MGEVCERCEKLKQFLLEKFFCTAFYEDDDELQLEIIENLKGFLTDEDLVQIIEKAIFIEVREKAASLLSQKQRELAIQTLKSCMSIYDRASCHEAWSRCADFLEGFRKQEATVVIEESESNGLLGNPDDSFESD